MNRGVKYVYFFKQNSIVFYAAKIKKQKTREYKLIGFRMLYRTSIRFGSYALKKKLTVPICH